MVGDKQQNWEELEASLAPAEAEVGAMAKADQKCKISYNKDNDKNHILRL